MYIYYVYAYLREDNTPYYIGKGKDKRAYDYNHRSNPPVDLSKIKFYQTGLTEDDAFKLEIAYIKLFGRKDLGTGILRNLTDGGEGRSGQHHSEETRRKISKSNKGKIKSEETRRKISEGNKGKFGRICTEETRKKLSETSKGRIKSAETRRKSADVQRGRSRPPFTEEHLNNIRLSAKNRGERIKLENEAKRKASKV